MSGTSRFSTWLLPAPSGQSFIYTGFNLLPCSKVIMEGRVETMHLRDTRPKSRHPSGHVQLQPWNFLKPCREDIHYLRKIGKPQRFRIQGLGFVARSRQRTRSCMVLIVNRSTTFGLGLMNPISRSEIRYPYRILYSWTQDRRAIAV